MTLSFSPNKSEWDALLRRPSLDITELFDIVRPIVDEVAEKGDAALRAYAERFDKVCLTDLRVSEAEIRAAEALVSDELKNALRQAYSQIYAFHAAQRFSGVRVETAPGVVCEQRALPISRVGLYIPGGSAPLFSTVLMLGIPARIAGCEKVVLCTPPAKDGSVHPAILFAASLCGITEIFKVGGAQAVAAMAVGTETVPQVDKIFGPGNQYVMAAKQWVALKGTAIDMPAGPSEVEVLADDSARADFVAADLLSQAEHGPDSQAILITTSKKLAEDVVAEVSRQCAALPRHEIAEKALQHSKIIVFDTMEEALEMTNLYAPEHLIIATKDYREVAQKINHAGSVFLGNYSCESAGDYASGTNHTLPTSGFAKSYSGLCLDSFMRKITFQELTEEGIRSIGRCVELMASEEALDAHRNAMTLRLAACSASETGATKSNIGGTISNIEARISNRIFPNSNSVSHLVRPNVIKMEAYSSARDEYSGKQATVFLDANESPYNAPFNRYPDPLQTEVKAELAKLKSVRPSQLFLGNGSDEAIDLVFRVFCRPGVDNVVALEPTYGMYAVCAATNDVEYRRVLLREDFSFRAADVLQTTDANTKAIFLCSPNNPTGNLLPHEEMDILLKEFPGIVVVDEAYGDFVPEASLRFALDQHPRLIVLATFSKAWASAGLRLGIAMASEEIIGYFNKVKYPYNVNILTQQQALEILKSKDLVADWINLILAERSKMVEALEALPDCQKVYPSDANFVLAKINNATALYNALVDRGIIVRNRSKVRLCNDCLRITIGTPEENKALLAALREITS